MLKMMLIDDNRADREFYQEAATRTFLPMSIEALDGGSAALEVLRAKETVYPDLVLLDINMPVSSGWEVLKEIKEDNLLREIPVIIFTSSCNPDDVKKAYRGRACMYVQKPSGIRDTTDWMKALYELMDYVILPFDRTRQM